MSDDGKVVSLVPKPEPEPEPEPKNEVEPESIASMVKMLEEITDRVKAGEVRGVAVSYVLVESAEFIGGSTFDAEGGTTVSHLYTMTTLLANRLLGRL